MTESKMEGGEHTATPPPFIGGTENPSSTPNRLPPCIEDTSAEYYLTVSSGGAASVLGGLGAVLGCSAAGINKFRMIGGVSGGSIISSLAAVGTPINQLLHLGLNLSFTEMVTLWSDVFNLFNPAAYVRRIKTGRHTNVWRCTGLHGTEPLAQFLRKQYEANGHSGWPQQYWTMATTKEGAPIVFTANGVHLIKLNGTIEKLADSPPALERAVQMSSTIPGVIAAQRCYGRFIFDGALSRYGICPVGLQIQHFGTDPRKIIACHIGDDSKDPLIGRFHSVCRFSWGVDPRRNWGEETAGVIEFRPNIEHVHTLKFHLSRDEKWLAILIGFEACVSRLAFEGILTGAYLKKTQDIMRDLGYWRNAVPAEMGKPQPIADRAEACLREHGFF